MLTKGVYCPWELRRLRWHQYRPKSVQPLLVVVYVRVETCTDPLRLPGATLKGRISRELTKRGLDGALFIEAQLAAPARELLDERLEQDGPTKVPLLTHLSGRGAARLGKAPRKHSEPFWWELV